MRRTTRYNLVYNRCLENDVINRSVAMETKLRVSLLLATLPILLGATSLGDGRTVVEDFYCRFNSTREADLIFVLDRSGSVTRKLWISMVNFVKVFVVQLYHNCSARLLQKIKFIKQFIILLSDTVFSAVCSLYVNKYSFFHYYCDV